MIVIIILKKKNACKRDENVYTPELWCKFLLFFNYGEGIDSWTYHRLDGPLLRDTFKEGWVGYSLN